MRTFKHFGATHRISRENLTDVQVATLVRMLGRSDIDHELTCTVARDRILCLTQEKKRLQERLHETAKIVQQQSLLIKKLRKKK